VSDADELDFTPEQTGLLRAQLGLEPGEEPTAAMVLLMLETRRMLADEMSPQTASLVLILEEAGQVVGEELDYLHASMALGWSHWERHLDVTKGCPPELRWCWELVDSPPDGG
jgi:hypothetical protein